MLKPLAALLAEDDLRLAKFTADYLSQHEVHVTHVTDGEAALSAILRHRYDVIVLDVVLPRKDGISVCRTVRESSDVPIVMTTARAEEADRVLGLESGADDYLVKPFSLRELLARIRAVVRRDQGKLVPRPRIICAGALVIHEPTRTVSLSGTPVVLTSVEFDLLTVFAKHPGRILSREQLLRLAHGSDQRIFDRAIDVQVSRLRQKLSAHAEGGLLIRTVRGVGYVLADDERPR
jgi:two-component system, OmpR family, response regulator